MATVKVYRFKRYDLGFGAESSKWGTLRAIESLFRCVPLMTTGRDVEEVSLDRHGFLDADQRSEA